MVNGLVNGLVSGLVNGLVNGLVHVDNGWLRMGNEGGSLGNGFVVG